VNELLDKLCRINKWHDEDGWSVKVGPGTSQNLDNMYSGEFTVECAYAESGLTKDTKFKLGRSINLAYTDMHFIAIKGKTPKIGDLPRNQIIGRRFVVAAKTFVNHHSMNSNRVVFFL
jgi:hypothetical protein